MSETKPVRLKIDTIQHIHEHTRLSDDAPFTEKAHDIVTRTETGVTLTADTIEDLKAQLAPAIADEVEARLR